MKKNGLIFIFMAGIIACGSIPIIRKMPSALRAKTRKTCLDAFPKGRWSVVHTIGITLPDGGHSMMVGISTRDESGLHSVLMSPEGVVLFHGDYRNGSIHVSRALPPMNDPEFQRRMFSDIRFLFIPPETKPSVTGLTKDKKIICRWITADHTLDVYPGKTRIIKEYTGKSVTRDAIATGPVTRGFARRVVFNVHGMAGYRMVFTLVEVR